MQYRDRLEDIRLLKLKLKELKRELHLHKNTVTNVDALRKELSHLQKELLQERLKVKALSEELENPMNVHRWRKLEGSDPNTYEMIQKIQTLQKRLIAKTEQVVEKDLLIQEKEKLYAELKSILARQPGPEVSEQLNVYAQNLREKNSQLKAMAGELNMYQAQVNEFKYEIERLTRELQEVKKKYFEQKRKDQIRAQQQQQMALLSGGGPGSDGVSVSASEFRVSAPAGQTRFTGGGFALTASAAGTPQAAGTP
jgi:chromosome segregation ATPase